MAVAVVIVIVALLGLAVAGSVAPLEQEAGVAALRVETLRAFYAAESGAVTLIGLANGGHDLPASGDEVVIGHQHTRFVSVPEAGGEVVIEGASGSARRRVELQLE